MYYYKRKNRTNKLLWLFIIVILISFFATIFFSELFERKSPTVLSPDNIYWNLKQPIHISIGDNQGIKSYKVSLIKEDVSITLAKGKGEGKQSIDLDINFPAKTFYPKGDTKLKIEVTDTSLWNFISGNTSTKYSNIIIDRKKPKINIISKSYGIALGGSALVIFQAKDNNLKTIKITTNNKEEFQVIPFYKEGYYISLIARNIKTKSFRAYIEANDKAGNKRKKRIPFFNKNKRYKVSKLNLRNSFLDGKISDLYAENFELTEKEIASIKKFVKINENLRNKNSDLIKAYSKQILEPRVDDFSIKIFEPLKNYSAVASYGDHRFFYLNKKLISESYHLGLDLANVKHGNIYTSNKGKVVFTGMNGIYGNMPIIYHGLGLYSVYGHCNELLVTANDEVAEKQVIGRTGKTGLALGDHLHFELRVQGIPVRPAEWMDSRWIKLNVDKPIAKAKAFIDGKAR